METQPIYTLSTQHCLAHIHTSIYSSTLRHTHSERECVQGYSIAGVIVRACLKKVYIDVISLSMCVR